MDTQDSMAAPAPDKPSITSFMRPELPEAALHGLPGRVAAELAVTSGADPAALLVSFMVAFGNTLGRHPHIMLAGAEHPAREFAVIVGDAATGRKGTAWQAVKALVREAEPDWTPRIVRGIQSPESVVDKLDDTRLADSRLMIVETEFSRLIRKLDRMAGMGEMFRNAWDGEPLERMRAGKFQRASEHHISLLGMITPPELLRLHQTLSESGGLESRMLYVISAPDSEIDPFEYTGTPRGLAGKVQAAIEFSLNYVIDNTGPISAELCLMRGIMPPAKGIVSEEVHYGWRKIKARLPKVSEEFQPYVARAEAHVIRLALIYALADRSISIEPEHIDAALALWEFCAQCAERIFSIPVGKLPPVIPPQKMAKVFRYLHESYPGWVSKTEISVRALGRNSPADELNAILDSLTSQGMAEKRIVKPQGSGKPRTEYALISS
jgi:hypothetical protein